MTGDYSLTILKGPTSYQPGGFQTNVNTSGINPPHIESVQVKQISPVLEPRTCTVDDIVSGNSLIVKVYGNRSETCSILVNLTEVLSGTDLTGAEFLVSAVGW